MKSLLEVFFENAATRLNSENNMSDFTWVVCNTSDTFKRLFIGFFFEDLELDPNIVLKREFSHESGRPDFKFDNKGKTFIIEIKKYDRNLHKEYECFGNDKVAIIAIYRIIKRECNFITKTWEEFVKFIENSTITTRFHTEDEIVLVKGYLCYIKKVCNIIKSEKMNLSNLTSLFQFNHLIERIVQTNFSFFDIQKGVKGNFHDRSGYNFYIINTNTQNVLQGWYGIFYNAEKVVLCIGIWPNNDPATGNSMVFTAFNDENILIDGNYLCEIYPDDKWIWIEPSKVINIEFLSSDTSIEIQIKILNDFFQNVIIELGSHF